MREIKFRAWNKVVKKMMDAGGFSPDFMNMTTAHILMQYTGLKDRNGKEIYEGDIVIPDRAPYCQGLKDGDSVVVEWLDCGGWYPFSDDQDGQPYPNPGKSEVVGNIYERPLTTTTGTW